MQNIATELAAHAIIVPTECINFKKSYHSFVYDDAWQPYVVMGAVGLCYGSAAVYFYANRSRVVFLTRSPSTVAIGLICLGIDSVLNTLLFSELTLGNIFHW